MPVVRIIVQAIFATHTQCLPGDSGLVLGEPENSFNQLLLRERLPSQREKPDEAQEKQSPGVSAQRPT